MPPPTLEPVFFIFYLRTHFPSLYRKLVLLNSWKLRVKRLDDITLLYGSTRMDLRVACARWFRVLTRMYSINGDLEF